jgi:Protein of unknown function (DUF3551)
MLSSVRIEGLGSTMKRREFITVVGGAVAWQLSSRAKQFGVLTIVVVAAALMLFTVGAVSADPYKWCAVDSSSGGTNCGFVTIEQCRATISGQGGFCEPKQVVPPNLSPAARAAAPKTNASGGNGLMECVTESCKINCTPKVAKRFRPKWCGHFKEPI